MWSYAGSDYWKKRIFYSQICATSVKWLKSLIIFSKPVQHSNTKLKIWKIILIKFIHAFTLWTKTGQTECFDITEFVFLFVALQSTYRLQCMGQRRDLGCLLFQSFTQQFQGMQMNSSDKEASFPRIMWAITLSSWIIWDRFPSLFLYVMICKIRVNP